MTISNGFEIQILTIFPPTQLAGEVPLWLESPYGEEECMFPLLTLEELRGLQEQSQEHVLHQFLFDTICIEYPISFSGYHHVFSSEFKETCYPTIFA